MRSACSARDLINSRGGSSDRFGHLERLRMLLLELSQELGSLRSQLGQHILGRHHRRAAGLNSPTNRLTLAVMSLYRACRITALKKSSMQEVATSAELVFLHASW